MKLSSLMRPAQLLDTAHIVKTVNVEPDARFVLPPLEDRIKTRIKVWVAIDLSQF